MSTGAAPPSPTVASPAATPAPAAAPAAPPSRQEIERRLSISLPSAPKVPLPPPLETPRTGKVIREAMSESEEGEAYEGEDDEDEEDDDGIDDEDGEVRRKVHEERVVRSGYLEKKGEKRKTWKKRWFVLRTGKLSFYKDAKEYKLLRIIDLADIHSASLMQHAKYSSAFGVVTARRTFYLKARDKQEAEGWVADINAARNELKERDVAAKEHASSVARSDDPTRVILSAYLMKLGSRKAWRKRWFVLTSQSLIYSSSHMDTKPHRVIPMASILDALEYEPEMRESSFSLPPGISNPLRATAASGPSPASLDVLSSSSDASPSPHTSPKQLPAASPTIPPRKLEHTFKIVSSKRTFVLCAPTEEEEVMWLSAIQALIARRTSGGSAHPPPAPPAPAPTAATVDGPTLHHLPTIPSISEQPPSPPASDVSSQPPGAPPTASRGPSPSRSSSALGHLPGIEAQLDGTGGAGRPVPP